MSLIHLKKHAHLVSKTDFKEKENLRFTMTLHLRVINVGSNWHITKQFFGTCVHICTTNEKVWKKMNQI